MSMNNFDNTYEDLKNYRRSLNFSIQTERTLSSHLKKFIKFLNRQGVETPNMIRNRHLIEYQKFLVSLKNSKGLPLKPGTVNNLISGAKILLEYLHKNGYVQKDLIHVLKMLKLRKCFRQVFLNMNR